MESKAVKATRIVAVGILAGGIYLMVKAFKDKSLSQEERSRRKTGAAIIIASSFLIGLPKLIKSK